ncbi:MAG: AI-2E family transporter [Halobacteriota archaeon]
MDVRTGFFVLFLAIVGVVSALLVLPLLRYVMAAALLSFALYPVHRRLSRVRIEIRGVVLPVGSRISAGVLTAVAIVAAIVPMLLLSVILLQTVRSFLTDTDGSVLVAQIREAINGLGVTDSTIREIEQTALTEIEGLLDRSTEMLFQEIVGLLNMSIRMGVGLLVLVFLLYYFLVDGTRLIRWIGDVAPVDPRVYAELTKEIRVVTWAVLKSHVFVAVIEGLLAGFGFYLLGVPNVVFWTVVMIVVSFLPAIGIWLIWAPAVVYLVIAGLPVNAFALLIYGITVLSVIDNYMRAILVDRGAHVHPAIVLIGVIGGIYLLGIVGLFLGPVLLAVFKAGLNVFGEFYDTAKPVDGGSSR